MPLNIVKASDPMLISNLVLTVYGAPGLGKSSLAFTADKCLLLDFDKGAYRAQNRGDAVQVSSWADIATMTAQDLAPYQTIAVDTAGRALDVLSIDIIAQNPKAGRGDGSLTLPGFGTLKSRFAAWQTFVRSLGKDVVLVCHMQEEKQGDDIIERIDAQGASKNEIYKSSDAMCRIQIGAGGQRFLNFDPREGGFGKNPAQLPRIPFPSPKDNPHLLAEVIAQIKASINHMTQMQAQAVTEQQQWAESLAECTDIETFNRAVVPLMKERGKEFRTFAAAEAKKRGYRANKATGYYEETKIAEVA